MQYQPKVQRGDRADHGRTRTGQEQVGALAPQTTRTMFPHSVRLTFPLQQATEDKSVWYELRFAATEERPPNLCPGLSGAGFGGVFVGARCSRISWSVAERKEGFEYLEEG